MKERAVDRTPSILELIDTALDEPPVPIVEALWQAVQHKRLTIAEAQDCIEAYKRGLERQGQE